MRNGITGLLVFGALLGAPLVAAAADKPAAAEDGQKAVTAIFAAGCFWCTEADFDKVEGVLTTTSGYIGGPKPHPTYQEVSAGGTGHFEAVKVTFDPAVVTYKQLLQVYWHNVDPLDARGQFCDKGSQYLGAIFYDGPEQERLAEESKAEIEKSGVLPGSIVTQIIAASTFYPAEDYHQDYYEKNPVRYRFYRYSCGRDARLEEVWGKARGSS